MKKIKIDRIYYCLEKVQGIYLFIYLFIYLTKKETLLSKKVHLYIRICLHHQSRQGNCYRNSYG